MSVDVLLDIDPLVVEELDAPIPCEGENHPRGRFGHNPTAPAAFLQIVPGCNCGPIYKCAGYRDWFMTTQTHMACPDCDIEIPKRHVRFEPINGVTS